MKLIIDENIAFAEEAFSGLGNVKLLDGRYLKNKDVNDTDALIVRSVTKVDEELIKNSIVKFVGTATIGTDHIDLDYLQNNNIEFSDAKDAMQIPSQNMFLQHYLVLHHNKIFH